MRAARFGAILLLGALLPRAAFSATAKSAAVPAVVPVVASTAAVVLEGKTILVVQDRMFSLSAEERAERAGKRIHTAARNASLDPADIRVTEGEGISEIAWGETVLLAVTESDAKAAGVNRAELAETRANSIRRAVVEFRGVYGVRAFVTGAGFALLLTALVLLAFMSLNAGYDRYAPVLDRWAESHLPGLRIQSIEFVPAKQMAAALSTLVYASYIAAAGLLLYLYLPAVLGLFPWTQGASQKLFSYVLSPVRSVLSAIVHYIPNLIFIVVIIAFFHYALRALHVVFREISRGRLRFSGFHPEWAEPTFQIARFLSWAFALVVIFPYLPGSSSPAFQGVSVFMGLLLSLGSGSAVANAVAGVIITYMRPFRIGDRVKISDTTGDVVERTILVTRIRTIKNVEVTIPNALALSAHIINYSALAEERGLIVHTSVTIGYDAPWPKVHELLIAAAGDTEGLEKDPKPFVLQTALGDFSVCYEINAYTHEPQRMAGLLSGLHAHIQDRFNAAGIEIMSPVFEVRRDGPASTVVPRAPKAA